MMPEPAARSHRTCCVDLRFRMKACGSLAGMYQAVASSRHALGRAQSDPTKIVHGLSLRSRSVNRLEVVTQMPREQNCRSLRCARRMQPDLRGRQRRQTVLGAQYPQ
jgi:hypothetical protein